MIRLRINRMDSPMSRALQLVPPLVLLKTSPDRVPAYTVVGVRGSIAKAVTWRCARAWSVGTYGAVGAVRLPLRVLTSASPVLIACQLSPQIGRASCRERGS